MTYGGRGSGDSGPGADKCDNVEGARLLVTLVSVSAMLTSLAAHSSYNVRFVACLRYFGRSSLLPLCHSLFSL